MRKVSRYGKPFFLLLISGLFAKASYSQIRFGGVIGPNFSGATVKYPTYDVSGARPGIGFEIGGFAELPLTDKRFSFRPGLSYSLERASAIVEGDKSVVHISFIKLPLDFTYHSAPENPFFFGLGPYIAYNLGGKYNWADTRTTSIAFGNDQGDYGRTYKKIDLGLDLLAGYQFSKQIVFSATVDFGLLNMIHTTEDPDEQHRAKIHTLNLGLTVGYLFAGE